MKQKLNIPIQVLVTRQRTVIEKTAVVFSEFGEDIVETVKELANSEVWTITDEKYEGYRGKII